MRLIHLHHFTLPETRFSLGLRRLAAHEARLAAEASIAEARERDTCRDLDMRDAMALNPG